MGRPSLYTDEILETICQGLSKGIPLTVICREQQAANPGFPEPRTVRSWEQEDETIAAAIARARADGEEAMAEQCLEIADEREGRAIMADGAEVAVVFDSTAVQRNKLRIDTRLKLLAKFNPKRWGDKVDVATKHSGVVGLAILTAVPEAESEPDDAE
ncbi:hypothetical protein [Luteibacter sp.]|uniref:terminase small subunit-like protein n=1 Tax=Luteibacter sp. TaxID=1886636 RepID=UPI002809E96E|nr:hypothetical protein [Luteibacter sp.]MDQ8050725.1 hypothetical protein [Luteibacter sp.]